MNGVIGKVNVDGHTLGRLSAFASLALDEREKIAGMFQGYRYGKHQQILRADDSSRSLYFLLSGKVYATVILYESNDREVPYEDLEAGAMFGELAAIDGAARATSIVTRSESSVLKLSAEDSVILRMRYPEFGEYTLQHLARMVRNLVGRVYELRTECAKPRVLAELHRRVASHADPAGAAVLSPPPTDQQIADYAGTQREVVCRLIGDLSREGIVRRNRRELVVTSVDRLVAFSCADRGH